MPRYEGWRVLRGDTDRQDLLDLGKKLLGDLAEQRRLSGVKTMQLIRQTPDGSLVRARFLYDVPVIEVVAAPRHPREIPTEPNATGFVVTATTSELQAGIDPTYPQQILKPAWTTFFKSKSIFAFSAFSGKKGTYGARFSDGVIYAGNIDWRDADPDGVRINYYGPTLRYWYDTYRKPTAQYGRWVFLNGAILLDIDAYCTDSEVDFAERLVLGAALVGQHLFVMQAHINDFAALNVPVDYPDNRKTWVSEPYPPGDTTLRLVRYRIEKNPNPTGSNDLYRVIPGSGDTFWTHTGRGWVNPFVFNPTATACESFAMPDELRWTRFIDQDADTTEVSQPSADSEHVLLSIGDSIAAATFTTLSEPFEDWHSGPDVLGREPSCTIAADYAPDGSRIEVKAINYSRGLDPITELPWSTIGIQFDDGPPLDLKGNETSRFYTVELLCVDARKKLVLARSSAGAAADLRVRLFMDGTLLTEAVIPNPDIGGSFLLTDWRFYPCGFHLENALDYSLDGLSVDGPANFSPLFLTHGLLVFGQYGSSKGLSSFVWRPYARHPEIFTPGEVVGYSGGYAGYTPSGTHYTPGTDEGVFRTLNLAYGHGWQDALGYRTPNTMAVDDAMNVLCSAVFHFSCLNDITGFSGHNAMVNLTYSPLGMPRLRDLTEVSGNEDPYHVGSPPTNFDARYSPIWLIGKPPKL